MDSNTKTADQKNPAPTLYIIAICKLAKGLILLLVAAGIYSLAGKDLQADFDRFLEWVRLDPEHSFFRSISESLADWPSSGEWHQPTRDECMALTQRVFHSPRTLVSFDLQASRRGFQRPWLGVAGGAAQQGRCSWISR